MIPCQLVFMNVPAMASLPPLGSSKSLYLESEAHSATTVLRRAEVDLLDRVDVFWDDAFEQVALLELCLVDLKDYLGS